MANKIELTGVDSILAALRQRSEAASKRIESRALRAAGAPMAKAMRERAARSNLSRTYHLQDNIVVSGVKSEDGIKFVRIGPNRKVGWRAHFVEFGTSRQSAEPYIEPGYREKKDEALRILAAELRKGLR